VERTVREQIMEKYTVKYNGKEYTYNANSCEEAAQKLANRKVFGRELIFDFVVRMIDADTRGKVWGEFFTKGHDVNLPISVEIKK
jgi:hypothetical protein